MKDSLIWYALVNGKSLGPYSENIILRKVSSKELSEDTLIWNKDSGNPDWKKIRDVFEIRREILLEDNEDKKTEDIAGIKNNAILSFDNANCGSLLTRRYIARAIDNTFFTKIGQSFFLIVPEQSWILLFYFSMILDFVITALFIGLIGTTPGKYIAGLRVLDASNHKYIGFYKALKREFLIFFITTWGVFLLVAPYMIPENQSSFGSLLIFSSFIIYIVLMITQYKYYKKRGQAKWDEKLNTIVEYKKQGFLSSFIKFILVFTVFAFLVIGLYSLVGFLLK